MRRRETDVPLAEVGLSGAQYGALVVESVAIFLCEQVRVCVRVCASKFLVSCVSSVLMPFPVASLCLLRCARASASASLSTPLRSKYRSAGKAKPAGQGLSSRGTHTKKKKGRQPAHRPFFIPH